MVEVTWGWGVDVSPREVDRVQTGSARGRGRQFQSVFREQRQCQFKIRSDSMEVGVQGVRR